MPTELRDCAKDSKILERASDLEIPVNYPKPLKNKSLHSVGVIDQTPTRWTDSVLLRRLCRHGRG